MAIDTGMPLPINWPPKGACLRRKRFMLLPFERDTALAVFLVVRIAVECLRLCSIRRACEKEF